MGPYWFGPPRSTFTVSGGVLRVCSILHHHRFLTPAIPLCGLPFSSKQHLATALTCAGECASPGVPFPLQRSTTGGARIPRWLTSPPALSVHRVSHPLNGLLRPRSCQALHRACTRLRPNCAPGVPPASFGSRLALQRGQGRTTPGFLSKALPNPATSAFSRALLSCTSPVPSSNPFGTRRGVERRALQSFDRRIVGSSTIANRGRRPS